MRREAASILKRSGLALDWRVGTNTEVFQEPLVIVKLKGQCDMQGPILQVKRGPLGWTHSADGALLPFSELACDNIRHAVQSAMRADDYPRADLLLGRAMGRVVAHELYHIVGATSGHGHEGVGRPALSGEPLIGDRLDLHPAYIELRQYKVHPLH